MSFSVKTSTLKLFSVAVRATGKYGNRQLSFTKRSTHLPNSAEEPETCVTMYGERVPYPKGRENPLTLPVSRHGIDAIQLGDENYPSDKMYNEAKIHYLEKRQYMMLGDIGKWVASGSNGAYVAGNTQRWVRDAAEFLFPRGENEYYLNCIGKELVCCVAMDAFTGDRDRYPLLKSLENNEYRVNAQYWDGIKFVQCKMKHSSGSSMMGVPKEVLNSIEDTSLVRAEELDIYGPFNIRKKSRCYHNFRVLINGLVTKTTAIETQEFLLGYPVINRYRNVIDATAEEPVTMTPLPGRVNADNCNIEMYVLLNLLKEWMYLVDIGKLDSALCSIENRPFFKHHLKNCELNFNHELLIPSEVSLLSWIVSHNLTLSSLFLKEESIKKPSIVGLLKKHKFNCLKRLTITGPGYKCFKELIAGAVNLENLMIENASTMNLNTLKPMLNACSQNLKILTLSGVDITLWNAQNINSFAVMLPNLVEFNLVKHTVTTASMKHLLKELFKISNLLKITIGIYILPSDELSVKSLNCFLSDVHCDMPFDAEVLRYSPVTEADRSMSVTWEKQRSECGTKYTKIITAINNDPFSPSHPLSVEPKLKSLVIENYKSLLYVNLKDVGQVTSLSIRHCRFLTCGCDWFQACDKLLELHIVDSHSSASEYRSFIMSYPTTIIFPALCKLTIIDNNFHNAENWADAVVFYATESLKQVVISVPEAEMHKTVNDEVSSRLAKLGATLTYMVRK